MNSGKERGKQKGASEEWVGSSTRIRFRSGATRQGGRQTLYQQISREAALARGRPGHLHPTAAARPRGLERHCCPLSGPASAWVHRLDLSPPARAAQACPRVQTLTINVHPKGTPGRAPFCSSSRCQGGIRPTAVGGTAAPGPSGSEVRAPTKPLQARGRAGSGRPPREGRPGRQHWAEACVSPPPGSDRVISASHSLRPVPTGGARRPWALL